MYRLLRLISLISAGPRRHQLTQTSWPTLKGLKVSVFDTLGTKNPANGNANSVRLSMKGASLPPAAQRRDYSTKKYMVWEAAFTVPPEGLKKVTLTVSAADTAQ